MYSKYALVFATAVSQIPPLVWYQTRRSAEDADTEAFLRGGSSVSQRSLMPLGDTQPLLQQESSFSSSEPPSSQLPLSHQPPPVPLPLLLSLPSQSSQSASAPRQAHQRSSRQSTLRGDEHSGGQGLSQPANVSAASDPAVVPEQVTEAVPRRVTVSF